MKTKLTYEEEKLKEKECLNKLKQIADNMGYTYDNTENYYNSLNIKKDQKAFYMYFQTYGVNAYKKITICPIYPRNEKGEYISQGLHLEINVSMDKSIVQIIRDIEVRLMPQYTKNLEKLEEQIKENKKDQNNRQYIINTLSSILEIPCTIENEKNRNYPEINKYFSDQKTIERLKIKPSYYATSLNFEFEVDNNIAIEICELLKKYTKKDK